MSRFRIQPAVWAAAVTLTSCTPTRTTGERDLPEPPKPAVLAAPSAASSALARPAASEPRVDPGPPTRLPLGGPRAISGRHGVVVSVERQASAAGKEILEAGGNAADAAVAVAYALAVTHPSAGNIGGGGFLLVRPKGGPTVAIDFRETAPKKLDRQTFDALIADDGLGPTSVGVPGTVAGLALAHRRFGKLPLAKVLAPALRLAQRGFRVGSRQAATFQWNWQHLKQHAETRTTFGEGDKPRAAGSRMKRPELAKTLQRISDHGAAGFYEGPVAKALVAGLGPKGILTLEDLAGYEAKERSVLRVDYRDLNLEIMPPPSAGGVTLALILTQLARHRAWEQPRGSATDLHLFLEASRRAQAERRFGVVDPDSLTDEVALQRQRDWLAGTSLLPIDPDHATPSKAVHPLFEAVLAESPETTHFSVVDASGMVVSCTTTLSAGFGSKLMPAHTGVVLNNSVASFATVGRNLPSGGRRTISSMAPTLVLKGGEVVLVLGSPGGDTIPSTIAQVFRNVVDGGMTLDAAVDAARVHHGFVPDEVRYERRRPPPKAILQALEKLGHHFSDKRIPIGDANNVLIADGVAYAYADPREGGLAVAAKAATP